MTARSTPSPQVLPFPSLSRRSASILGEESSSRVDAPIRAVPLRYRLPNPPPVFVGREREMDVLAAAIERCPVAIVCGPGGVGKTALAIRALTRLHGFGRERAVYIDIRPGQPIEDARRQIIRALTRAQSPEQVDWFDVVRDEDAAGAALIDLAESSGSWVVLDDLHHIEPPAAAALLVLLARYARRSRWIVTSRTLPHVPELTPQMLPLSGLSEDDLRKLATACAPGLPEAEMADAVSASGGSPWLLQQLLVSPAGGSVDDRLLGALPDGALEFLRALSSVDKALPLEVLGSFTNLPIRDVLPVLEQRSLIQHSYGGYRLHDVVRRTLRNTQTRRSLPSPLIAGRSLSAQCDPEAMLEGARLLLSAGVAENVVDMLDTCGEALIEEGCAPRLWQLLELSQDARLSRWRLRCAVALAQPSLFARLEPPRDAEPQGRLLWARGLFIQGLPEEALELASILREEAGRRDDKLLSAQAGLLAVECLNACRKYLDASAMLQVIEPTEPGSQALHESWTVYCLAAIGHADEAARRLLVVQHQAASLPVRVRNEVLLNLAMVMGLLGQFREAYAASKLVMSTSLPSAKCLSIHFVDAMYVGRFEEAGQLLRRLESFRVERSPLHRIQALYTIYYQVNVGELAAFEEAISCLKSEIRRAGDMALLGSLLRFETWYRMSRAESPFVLPGEDEIRDPSPWSILYTLRWRVRAGERLANSFDEHYHERSSRSESHYSPSAITVVSGDPGGAGVLASLVKIEALLLRGDATGALQLCARALDETRLCGWGSMEVEIRQTHCDILVVLGRWGELEQAIEAFSTMAAEMPSPRHQAEARWFRAFLLPKSVDWGLLEQLATQVDAAPIAARRARVLLGEESRLDAVDRLVLSALREQRGVLPASLLTSCATPRSSAPWAREEPAWGLSDDEHRVWRSDGNGFSLADRPQLWNILVSLHEHGGSATKEQLVRDIWSESDYHPLHHDNRLQVAIRKLRQLIEDDPSRPARLVTTAAGYALVGRVRRVRDA